MSSLDRDATGVAVPAGPAKGARATATPWRRGALRLLATLVTVAIAAALGWFGWQTYMGTAWTRDGTVRAYVAAIAPEVAGRIVSLPVGDNAFVHKGDLLMQIDPSSYAIAVRQAEAGVNQAKAVAQNAEAEWTRRQKLNDLAVTVEEQQIFASKSLSANAQYQLALADLDNARLNLARTRIVSPVNGYVTNLLARAGDYANVGQRQVSLIDADSFWVDAYFEETFVGSIHDGDAASVKLMGYPQILRGHVQSLARGISVANATPSALGLATVNPIFAFVRLAQRVPVRIHLDAVPSDVRLVAGATATVAIDPGDQRAAEASGQAPATSPDIAATPAIAPRPAAPPPADGPAALPPAESSAAAILPPLSIGAGATGGAGDLPSKAPPPAADPNAAPPTPHPAPRETPASIATDETREIVSDEAFDRTLNILGSPSVDRPSHSPGTLRRRGRGWRHHERQ
jgi:multidrug resistance efflux pump